MPSYMRLKEQAYNMKFLPELDQCKAGNYQNMVITSLWYQWQHEASKWSKTHG